MPQSLVIRRIRRRGGYTRGMFLVKLLLRSLVTALGLYLTTLFLPAVTVQPYASGNEPWPLLLTYLLLGAVLTLVNAVLVPIVKVLTLPLYILTLGLFGLVITVAVFFALTWFSQAQLGWGVILTEPFLWTGVIAALLLAVINWVLNLVFKPVTK